MGDHSLVLASDFLDSADMVRLKTPNSFFYTDDSNKFKSDTFIEDESFSKIINFTQTLTSKLNSFTNSDKCNEIAKEDLLSNKISKLSN